MRGYSILKSICRIILPFVILYGLYLVLNGDISPGGGFQGGVVLGSVFLIVFFIKDEDPLHFKEIVKIEKTLFVVLILLTILHLTSFESYFKLLPKALSTPFATATLIGLNTIIGIKVAIGFWGIMLIFTEEGRL